MPRGLSSYGNGRGNAIRRTGRPRNRSANTGWRARISTRLAGLCQPRRNARGGKQPGFATQEMAKLSIPSEFARIRTWGFARLLSFRRLCIRARLEPCRRIGKKVWALAPADSGKAQWLPSKAFVYRRVAARLKPVP